MAIGGPFVSDLYSTRLDKSWKLGNFYVGQKCDIDILTRFSLFGGLLGPLLEHVAPRLLQLDEVDLEEVPFPEELVRHLKCNSIQKVLA